MVRVSCNEGYMKHPLPETPTISGLHIREKELRLFDAPPCGKHMRPRAAACLVMVATISGYSTLPRTTYCSPFCVIEPQKNAFNNQCGSFK